MPVEVAEKVVRFMLSRLHIDPWTEEHCTLRVRIVADPSQERIMSLRVNLKWSVLELCKQLLQRDELAVHPSLSDSELMEASVLCYVALIITNFSDLAFFVLTPGYGSGPILLCLNTI